MTHSNLDFDHPQTETLLIVPDIHEEEIRAAVEEKYSLKIDFFTVAANKDLGTADSLRLASKKIWVSFSKVYQFSLC